MHLTEYVNDVNRQYTQVLTEETNKRVQTSYTYGNTRESGNSIWEDSRDCIANVTSYIKIKFARVNFCMNWRGQRKRKD